MVTWSKLGVLSVTFVLMGILGYAGTQYLLKQPKEVAVERWTPAVADVIPTTSTPDADGKPERALADMTPAERDVFMLKNTNVYVYRGAPVAEGFAIYIVMWNGNYLFMTVVKEDTVLLAPEPDDDGIGEPQ